MENEEIYQLSDEELAMIKERIEQIDKGIFVTNEEANKRIAEPWDK